MANLSKPQRRTIIAALQSLVDKVNWAVFNAMDADEIQRTYGGRGGLLETVNQAEMVLDRERRTNAKPKQPST